jgi:ketosteroid isomerase-like protein
MKHLALVMAIACSALSLAAQGIGDGAARSNILALEHAWNQALERQDVKALAEIFDNALFLVDYDGKVMTKTEYLAQLRSKDNHLQQVVTDKMIVQLFGNTATVVGTYRETGTERGKPYVRRGRYMDVWMLEGANWICIGSSATPILH